MSRRARLGRHCLRGVEARSDAVLEPCLLLSIAGSLAAFDLGMAGPVLLTARATDPLRSGVDARFPGRWSRLRPSLTQLNGT